MIDVVAGLLLMTGALFCLVAAVGLVRLPDVYIRMHAATKAGAMGAGIILLAVAVHAGQLEVIMRVIAAILFVLLTAPIAAHLLGRSAYITRVKMWDGTVCDHLEGKYNPVSHDLSGLPVDFGPLPDEDYDDVFPEPDGTEREKVPEAAREASPEAAPLVADKPKRRPGTTRAKSTKANAPKSGGKTAAAKKTTARKPAAKRPSTRSRAKPKPDTPSDS